MLTDQSLYSNQTILTNVVRSGDQILSEAEMIKLANENINKEIKPISDFQNILKH